MAGWLEQASDLSLADGRLNLCLLAQLFHACNGLAISNDELQQYFAVSGEVGAAGASSVMRGVVGPQRRRVRTGLRGSKAVGC